MQLQDLGKVSIAIKAITSGSTTAAIAIKGLNIELAAQALVVSNVSKEEAIAALVANGFGEGEARLAVETALANAALKKQRVEVSGLNKVWAGLKATIVAHPYLAAAAAIATITVAVVQAKKKLDEAAQAARDKAVEAGEAAKDEQKKVEDLYAAYQKANEEYQKDASKKGELVEATDNLLQSLGEEGRQIRDLKKDYTELGDEISNVINKKRRESIMKMQDAVDAQRETIFAKYTQNSPYSNGYEGVTYDDTTQNEQRFAELIRDSVKSAVITTGSPDDYSVYFGTDANWGKKNFTVGNDKSPIERYQDLLDSIGVLDKLVEDHIYSSTEVRESSIYKYLREQIDELGPEIEKLNELIGETNAQAAQYTYDEIVAQKGLPKTLEEFKEFKQAMLDSAGTTDLFSGTSEEIANAIDKFLSSISAFDNFHGFNRFKEEFKSMDKDLQAAVKNMLKSTDNLSHNLSDEQVQALKKWADSVGYSTDEVIKYLERLGSEEVHSNVTLENIADLATLRDELAKTSKAWEEYNKILEGGDKGDAAKQMASAYQKAIEDIDAGRIDTKAVWGAAKLLFSDQQLAAMKYDLVEIAKELHSPMMEALFGAAGEDEDDYDIGVKFANYIKEHFVQFESAGAHIIDQGNGKFQFWYDSLGKLAKSLGMSEEALASLLDALDAYGVQSMRSTEETNQLRDQYLELFNAVDNTGTVAERTANAVKKLIDAMFSQGMNEHEISDVLTLLSNSGVIAQDVDTLNAEIAEAAKNLDDVDKSDAAPTVDANTTPANTALDNLWNRLNELATTKTEHEVVVNEVQGTTISDSNQSGNSHGTVKPGTRTPGYSTGTKNSPGGVALVNELGPELISDRGIAFIANHGKPGFVNLTKGAVVFNADETKDIFRNSYSNIPVKAFSNGTNNGSIRDRLISGLHTKAHRQVKGTDASGGGGSNYKTCPNCGAMCSTGSSKCGNCGYNFNTGKVDRPQSQQTQQTNYKYCPNCGAMCSLGTSVCGQCGYNFNTGRMENDDYVPYVPDESYTYDPTPTNGGYYYHNCANCNRQVSSADSICPYCGKDAWHKQSIDSVHDTDISKARPTNTNTGSKANTGGSSGYTGSGGGNYVGGADYGSQAEPEKVDWIAVAINRIQKAVADLEKVASSGFKKLSTRLNAAKKQVGELTKEIAAQEQGYDRYMAEAEGVGLSESIAKLVRDGTIDIREYDEETRKLIDSYSEWYLTHATLCGNAY